MRAGLLPGYEFFFLEIANCFFPINTLCSSPGVRGISRASASLCRCVNIYYKLWKFQGALKKYSLNLFCNLHYSWLPFMEVPTTQKENVQRNEI